MLFKTQPTVLPQINTVQPQQTVIPSEAEGPAVRAPGLREQTLSKQPQINRICHDLIPRIFRMQMIAPIRLR